MSKRIYTTLTELVAQCSSSQLQDLQEFKIVLERKISELENKYVAPLILSERGRPPGWTATCGLSYTQFRQLHLHMTRNFITLFDFLVDCTDIFSNIDKFLPIKTSMSIRAMSTFGRSLVFFELQIPKLCTLTEFKSIPSYISRVPVELGQLTNLKKIDLNRNNILGEFTVSIFTALMSTIIFIKPHQYKF